jgi:hypothetical protein
VSACGCGHVPCLGARTQLCPVVVVDWHRTVERMRGAAPVLDARPSLAAFLPRLSAEARVVLDAELCLLRLGVPPSRFRLADPALVGSDPTMGGE